MTAGGWFFMFGSVAAVCTLICFCFYRVLKKPAAANHTHAPLDIDTHDTDT